MSITSTLPAKGTKRKRQHPSGDDNNKEEQSSTKRRRPTFLSRFGRGVLEFFGGSALPGSQCHDGIVANNIGNNGHEAVYANGDDATNHQSQLDVNAGANIPTGAGALHDRTNTTNNRCPDAPIKPLERYLYGRRLRSSNEADVEENNYLGSVDNGDSTENDEEDKEDDFNDTLQQYIIKLHQDSAAKLGFQELQLLQDEDDRIEVAEGIRREFDQKEHEEEKERLRQIIEDSNWERGARDAFDEQDRQEEEDGYNELQHQKEEEEQHEMRQAELEWCLRELIDDGSDSSDEQAEQETDDAELASEHEQPLNEVAVVQRDEQCGDAEVAAMALEEEDEDMTEEVAMEALVDPRIDDDDALALQNDAEEAAAENFESESIEREMDDDDDDVGEEAAAAAYDDEEEEEVVAATPPPAAEEDCHHPLLNAPQRRPRPANAYDDPSLINLTTFDDVSDDDEEEEERLICTCQTCQLNRTDSISVKYSEDRMHFREFCDVVENPNEYKKKYPNIWTVMKLFDSNCLKGRKGPPRKSPRVNNKSNVEDAVPTNNAAANQDDGNQSYLQPINPAAIPDDIVLLGLAAKTQAEIDRGEPPNDAYRLFKQLLNKAHDKYRKGVDARKRDDKSEESKLYLCQIVKDIAAAMEGAGYRFVIVKNNGKPGHYNIQPTPAFQIASGDPIHDAGSLRKIIADKVRKVKKGQERAEAAEQLGDPTLDYIDKKLARDDLVSNGCSESFEDLDLTDVDWEEKHRELTKEINNMIQPSRFSVENDHVSAIEVFADEKVATLIEFLTEAELDKTTHLGELHTMLRDIGMCDELVADFEVPDPNPRPLGESGRTYRMDVGDILLDVMIFKQVQCPCCNRRSSDCKTRKELRSFQYDHFKDFIKSFGLTHFHTEGTDCPIPLADGYCRRLLFEMRKGRICYVACHEAGTSTGRHEEQLQRHQTLQIGPRPTHVYGHDESLSLREVFRLKEFWLFVKSCYLEGMWSQSRIGSKASLDKIDIICYKLFGMLATDQMKVTKYEWENEVDRISRAKYATDVIAHVAARLSGKCPGCGECLLNYNAVRLRLNEWNHRIPQQGDEDSNNLSDLRHNLLGWLKEAERGDCEGTCHFCHKDVTAYQEGGDKPLWYTVDRKGKPFS